MNPKPRFYDPVFLEVVLREKLVSKIEGLDSGSGLSLGDIWASASIISPVRKLGVLDSPSRPKVLGTWVSRYLNNAREGADGPVGMSSPKRTRRNKHLQETPQRIP